MFPGILPLQSLPYRIVLYCQLPSEKRGESFLYIFQQQRKGERKSTGTSGVRVRHDVTSTPGSRMIGYQPRHAFPQKR